MSANDELLALAESEGLDGRLTLAVLYVCGVLQELKERGLMENLPFHTTPKGICSFDQLVAEGFKPTSREWCVILDVMGMSDLLSGIIGLWAIVQEEDRNLGAA